MSITRDQIIERLKNVMDPEIDCDIWTMGLVYDIQIREEGSVYILYTLTSPFCPLAPQIENDIQTELKSIGVEKVELERTFEPAWQPTDELKIMLGLSV